jgi:hypothetical protein
MVVQAKKDKEDLVADKYRGEHKDARRPQNPPGQHQRLRYVPPCRHLRTPQPRLDPIYHIVRGCSQ